MEIAVNLQNEESLDEANIFLKRLEKIGLDKEYQLVLNTPDIYKKKILSASFMIKFDNDFYLKVLKKYNVYDFEFIPYCFKNGEIGFPESRDYSLNLFDILCEMYEDIYFDVNNYYPINFEETETFKEYFEYFDDKKSKRHYGIKIDKMINFLITYYEFIDNKLKFDKDMY